MRIAYLNLIYGSSVGVEERFREKAAASRELGLPIDFYMLNPSRTITEDGINYVRLKSKPKPLDIAESFFSRYSLIEKTADLDRYDYVLMRYPMADKSGIKFAARYPLVTEHHTDEAYEVLSQVRSKNATLKNRFISSVMYFLEKRYGPPLLRNCRAIVGLTDEIRRIELAKASKQLPATVIANGIDVRKISHTGFKKFDGKHLDIAFVMGAPHPWHGLDRMLKSISSYKGTVNITLHLIGNIDRSALGTTKIENTEIRMHGVLRGAALDSIMKDMNIAVSSLAEYRNHMQEACTLKTREYTARGIPFILAHDDPDLRSVDDNHKFFLNFANNDTLIDMNEIIGFVQDISKNFNNTHYMRNYSLKHMDISQKMKDYLNFIRNLH